MISKLGTSKFGVFTGSAVYSIDISYRGILRPQYYGATYSSALNQKIIVIAIVESYNTNRVFIELRRKEGGLKKIWWYSQDSSNPIEGVDFELTKKGSGGARIRFAFVDIPIEAEDYINIIISGEHVYRGFVENDVDISFPELVAKGYNQRLNEVIYSADYTLATDVIDILQDIIEASSSITGVTWRADLVDLGTVDPIITEYIDEYSGKIIDELIDRCNNRFWGVNVNNEFYVSEYNTGAVDQVFYNYDASIYEKADFKKDYSKIKQTESTVYRKDATTGAMLRIGTVADVGNVNYPEFDIIYKLRRIQGKLTASELVTNTTALEWAYLKLQNDVNLKTQISIKGVNVDQYVPRINDRILAEDDFKTSFLSVDDTQSAGPYTNSTLVNSGLENDSCVKLFFNPAAVSVFELNESKVWYKQEKIGFYMKGTTGKKVRVSFSNDLVNYTNYYIFIRSGEYEYYNFDFQSSFKYIEFENVDSSSWDCFLYKIKVLCYDKRQYTESIVNCKYTIDDVKITCDIQAGAMDEQESDKLFTLEKKIRILETINAI